MVEYKKPEKYTSFDIQNEILKVMSQQIIREIAANLYRTQLYTIMADETLDASDKEQVVLCFRGFLMTLLFTRILLVFTKQI